MEWQPIETAPRDGTVIDLYSFGPKEYIDDDSYLYGRVPQSAWNPSRKRWEHKSPWGELCVVASPTHWMPQPAPPCYASLGEWEDLPSHEETQFSLVFFDNWEYRIKPENKKFRVAQTNDGFNVAITEEYASWLSDNPCFKRWLTDWIEYEE